MLSTLMYYSLTVCPIGLPYVVLQFKDIANVIRCKDDCYELLSMN